MQCHRDEFEQIRSVLARVGVDEPLTAREILRVLEEHGVEFDSPHRIATVLGREAHRDGIEVIRDQPYRYRVTPASQ